MIPNRCNLGIVNNAYPGVLTGALKNLTKKNRKTVLDLENLDQYQVKFFFQGNFTMALVERGYDRYVGATKRAVKFDKYNRISGMLRALERALELISQPKEEEK